MPEEVQFARTAEGLNWTTEPDEISLERLLGTKSAAAIFSLIRTIYERSPGSQPVALLFDITDKDKWLDKHPDRPELFLRIFQQELRAVLKEGRNGSVQSDGIECKISVEKRELTNVHKDDIIECVQSGLATKVVAYPVANEDVRQDRNTSARADATGIETVVAPSLPPEPITHQPSPIGIPRDVLTPELEQLRSELRLVQEELVRINAMQERLSSLLLGVLEEPIVGREKPLETVVREQRDLLIRIASLLFRNPEACTEVAAPSVPGGLAQVRVQLGQSFEDRLVEAEESLKKTNDHVAKLTGKTENPSPIREDQPEEQRQVLLAILNLPDDAFEEAAGLVEVIVGKPLTEAFTRSFAAVLTQKQWSVKCGKCGQQSSVYWNADPRYAENGTAIFKHAGKNGSVRHGGLTAIPKFQFMKKIDRRRSVN